MGRMGRLVVVSRVDCFLHGDCQLLFYGVFFGVITLDSQTQSKNKYEFPHYNI